MDTSNRASQEKFGRLVGISRQAVGNLVARRVLPEGGTLADWNLAYCRHLRGVAAGRRGAGTVDVAHERGLLARSQREAQDIKNAIARGTYAPIEVLTATLSNAGVIVADALAALPAKIARAAPDLPSHVRQVIADTCDAARNDAADKLASMDFGDDD